MNNLFPKLKTMLGGVPSGMPSRKDLNAVSPGMHAPRAEVPVAIPTKTYSPNAMGDSLEQRYQNLQRVIRNKPLGY